MNQNLGLISKVLGPLPVINRFLARLLIVTRSVAFAAGKGWWGKGKYRSNVAAFIAVSEAVRSTLLAAGADPGRVAVASPAVPPRTVDCDAGASLRSRWSKASDFVIGSVGALERAKGYDVLLDALRLMRGNGAPARLLLLGEGVERRSLIRRAERLGVVEAFHLLERGTSVEALLGAVDVFVSSSRAEGFGMAVVEAMGAGVPCVVSDSGGVLDIVRDECDGLVVPREDPKALAAAMARIRADPELAAQLKKVTSCRPFGAWIPALGGNHDRSPNRSRSRDNRGS